MNQHDDLATRVGDALARRTDGLAPTTLTLDDVKGAARGIRRRRRAALAAGVAAAVAVLVPIGVVAADLGDDRTGPQPAPPGPTRAVDPNVGDGSPGLAYAADGVIHLPGGRELDPGLPGGINQLATLPDDRVVVATTGADGNQQVVVVDGADGADGAKQATYPMYDGALVMNGTGTSVAWLERDGTPLVLQSGLEQPVELAAFDDDPGYLQLVALVGDDCSADPETVEGTGCTLYAAGEGRAVVSSSHGFTDVLDDPAAIGLADVSPAGDQAISLLSMTDDYEFCHHVLDLVGGTAGTAFCGGLSSYHYSPSGAHVAAYFAEGLGGGDVSFVDPGSPGRVLATWRTPAGFATNGVAWEDDEHLLVVLIDDAGRSRVDRVAVDGSSEAGVLPEGRHSYVVETRP
ncbi:hypothetical protein [Nocardioides sp. SYSU D00038]|uniref:hypothetical protein n=1 Tax=Nocardioides sp. SYSU D00038 TaxID=2812554 RepID=UPI001967035C|nr:hypothetical protein [Nocardioides sp. SYSU D00038]